MIMIMRKFIVFALFLIMPASVWSWTSTNHMNSLTTSDGWYSEDGAGKASITSSQYAPGSASNSWQVMSPSGMADSSVTAILNFPFPSATKEFWMQYYFKYSSNFQWHTNANKQIYIKDATNQWGAIIDTHVFGESTMLPFATRMDSLTGDGWLYPNTSYNPSIAVNTWYKVTFHMKMVSAGKDMFQLWIDDRLVVDYQKLTLTNNYDAGFTAVNIDPVWGGQDVYSKKVTDYQWYDYVIVSTESIVAGQQILPVIPSAPSKLVIQ